MSYCRWSSDGFRCDIYAYEHVDGGFAIHCADARHIFPDDWRDPWKAMEAATEGCEAGKEVSDRDKERLADAFWRYKAEMARLDTFPLAPINLPSAGETFREDNLEDFLARMLALRQEGFNFPDIVLDDIRDEIRERDQRLKTGKGRDEDE